MPPLPYYLNDDERDRVYTVIRNAIDTANAVAATDAAVGVVGDLQANGWAIVPATSRLIGEDEVTLGGPSPSLWYFTADDYPALWRIDDAGAADLLDARATALALALMRYATDNLTTAEDDR